MHNKRIIILDFDGTLADTASVIIQTMQATIRKLGLPARTDEQCSAMIGLRLIEIPPVLFPECDLDAELYATTYRRLFHIYNTEDAVVLYPGVIDTLTELKKRGFTLTIASSRSHASLAEYIEKVVRMEVCFDELRQFDRTGQFLGKHPFIVQKSERERVADLLRSDPDRYFEERKNIELNITRYTSQIGSSRFSEEKKKKFQELLEQHQASLYMYREIFNEFIKQ